MNTEKIKAFCVTIAVPINPIETVPQCISDGTFWCRHSHLDPIDTNPAVSAIWDYSKYRDWYALKPEYQARFEQWYRDFIGDKRYNLIHCRFDDQFFRSENLPDKMGSAFSKAKQHVEENTVLLTNSSRFKQLMKAAYPHLLMSETQPVHTAYKDSLEETFQTVCEMLLATRATRCHSITTYFNEGGQYPYGVGFVRWPATTHGVPFTVEAV